MSTRPNRMRPTTGMHLYEASSMPKMPMTPPTTTIFATEVHSGVCGMLYFLRSARLRSSNHTTAAMAITVILTVIAIAAVVWFELRNRADRKKYSMPQTPLWTSVAKMVVVGGVIGIFGMLLASYKCIPVVGLILFGLVLIYTFVTQRTVLGRHIYAVGGNSNAARLSGVDTRRVSLFVMVNMGLLAGVAGMVFTAYLLSLIHI